MNDCRWAGRNQPRYLPNRHQAECDNPTCAGCQPCTEAHCRVCGTVHAEQTCGGCLDEARETLAEIVRLCGETLTDEAEAKGVESEAMHLLGPVADPEARGHLEASVAAGRVPDDYVIETMGENHPLQVLGTWEMVYRDAFDHDAAELVTIEGAAGYLDRNLTYASTWPHAPFEDFARDLRSCRAHLEAVLHDGEQVDRGAPCMTCRAPLERTWGDNAQGDGWRCPRCKQTSTDAQYRFAVMHLHREEAEWLTDLDMELRTGVRAGTVRSWASKGLVTRRQEQGRRVYSVREVSARAGIVGEDSA